MMYKLAILNSHPIQYFAPLYRRLAQVHDIDLTVYYCDDWGTKSAADPGFGREIAWDIPLLEGYRHRFLPNRNREGGIHNGFWGLQNYAILTELKRERFDAIWVHGYSYSTHLLTIMSARFWGTKVFFRGETHSLLHYSPSWRKLRRIIIKQIFNRCAAFLAIGTRNRQYYEGFGIPPNKIFPVPYTVDNDFFAAETAKHRPRREQLREALDIPDDAVVILFASKLVERKRPHDLLKALKALKTSTPVALIFVGSGPEEERLKQVTAEEGLRHVFFCGFQNQTQIPAFFATADIFVLPSENEPWGLIINEAMCAALPVVASAEIGAAADLVEHGVNGFVHQAGDIAALSDHLQKLVEDDRLRREMGRQSLRKIQSWSYEEAAAGVLAALKSL